MVLHLKYIIVIFILVCSTVGGMALFNQEFAIKSLSAASLLTSIVLAVVAILITLWDVAGQKSNIFTMQETLKSFKDIIEEFQGISGENESSIRELRETIVEMNENVLSYESKIAQIASKMESSDNATLKKEIEDILKQKDLSISAPIHTTHEAIKVNSIIEFVRESYNKDEEISPRALLESIAENFNISIKRARNFINILISKDIIEESRNMMSEENGMKVFRIFYKLN